VRPAGAALLAVAFAMLAPTAAGAQQLRLLELPGAGALPRVPPLAPPQPPPTETPPIRGTVFAREQVRVAIAADGAAHAVTVVQRLLLRSLGDYAFAIPAPATRVTPGPGSESRPGLRPNQIVWQGFSPRRKLLVAVAELRPRASVGALPVRLRVSGVPTQPGPFELSVTVQNATRTQATAPTGATVEADVTAALDALRAADRIDRPFEGRTVRLLGPSRPRRVDVWAPLALRGSIGFPAGSVRNLTTERFPRLLGGETVRVTVRGEAARATTPRIRLVAQPLPGAALPPPTATSLEAAVLGSLRYARTRQFQAFLANPDPEGVSTTSYIYETAAPERVSRARPRRTDGSGLPPALLVGCLVLVGAGLVVAWSHL
jgi:hypothetical protein